MAEETEETKKTNNRFAKWQSVTRKQLSATSNLILGLATGLLGFTTVLLIERKLTVSCVFGLGVTALVFLAVSIVLALWCATNRLTDFRLTAKIANPKNSNNRQLEEFREESQRLGDRTWNIFRSQIATFALGTGAIGVSIIIEIVSQR